MESSTQRGGSPILASLAGGGMLLLGLGGLASYFMTRQTAGDVGGRLREVGKAARQTGTRADVRRAGTATARGVRAGMGAAWDVTVGGADAVRTRANVMPTIMGSINEAQSSFSRAVNRTVGSITSFVGDTARTMFWLSVAGTILLFIYLPEPGQREQFFSRSRRYLDRARRSLGLSE